MGKKEDPEAVIDRWLEVDLTAAAGTGKLSPAFELDEPINQVKGVLAAGRCPVICGESGVGKSALVRELVRRAAAGEGPLEFEGRRVLQFSLQYQASGLKRPQHDMRPEMHTLMEALEKCHDEVVPFFRDFHLAYRYDLEPLFVMLGDLFAGRLLAEGLSAPVDMIFEQEPQLEQYYVQIPIEEPPLEKVFKILEAWSRHREETGGPRFRRSALEQALHLTHRFLARSRQPRKALELLNQLEAFRGSARQVDETLVFDCFCRNHNTPRFLVDPRIPLDLGELEADFSRRLLGQPEAIQAVVSRIGLIKAGLADMRRAFGAFLFAGPTGVGKTLLAQLLAEKLFGSRDRLVRLNMADYQDETSAYLLFGDPNADFLNQRRGLLTRRLQGHPLGVLLLDEFEKAHPKALDPFLQLVDEGCFTNGAGEEVSCRSMFIIATTNAGSEVYRGEGFGFGGPQDRQAKLKEANRRLEEHFRFEFLNRFDQVVQFQPLSREDIRTIALRELERLKERAGLRQRNIAIEVDEAVLDWLAAHGYDPDYGARFLRRTMERHATTALAQTMVRENPGDGAHIALSVRGTRIAAKVISPAEEERPARETLSLPVGTAEEIRKLGKEGLLEEAKKILTAATSHLLRLMEKKEERGLILQQMNEPDFWEKGQEHRDLLDRFRELDVSIRVEERMATSLLQLKEAVQGRLETSKDLKRVAPLLEKAASALREWEERLAEEGGYSVWLAVSPTDPLHPVGEWVKELVAMELGWCRKLGLTADVAAFDLLENEPGRVILDVEGPGTQSYLSMEQGLHRLCRTGQPDLRAQVEVIPKAPLPAEEWPGLAGAGRTKSFMNMVPRFRGALELKERGLKLKFLGRHKETLSHLLFDLDRAWQNPVREQPDLVRVYGEHGAGARDPRTGVTVPRLKDVLRGNLDRFLEAWRKKSNN